MESTVDFIFNAENIRMLVIVAFVVCGVMWLKFSFEKRIDGVEVSLNKKIDSVEAFLNKKIDSVEVSLNKKIDGVEVSLNKRIDGVEVSLNKRIDGVEMFIEKKIDEKLGSFHAQLKANDFAHLNNTIEALTFTLEKNKFLNREDKEYIDTRLDK